MPQNRPQKDEKVCFNCRYMYWGVGVGQGVRCAHLEHREENDRLMVIPHLRHHCSFFVFKEVESEEEAS
jgi:hypothetical protein